MPMRNPVLVSPLLAEGNFNPPKALTTQKEKGDKGRVFPRKVTGILPRV